MGLTPNVRGTIRIVVVEDHTIVREGTRRLLEAEPALAVVGEAATAREAIAQVERHRPDVVLLDLLLGDGPSGLDAARAIARTFPQAAVVVLTGLDDPEYAHAALSAGARAYLLKRASVAQVADAIRRVHAGERVLDPAVLGMAPRRQEAPRRRDSGQLTEREAAVYAMLGHGQTNAEIARALALSTRTVEGHVCHILAKLGFASRAVAISHAARESWGQV